MKWLADLFGGGVISSVERIASELIETDKESAEAKALMIKTLDPNGLMRRDISSKISSMYVVYIFLVMVLVLMQSFGVGDVGGVKTAISSLTELFVPITTMFTAIVGASFGVNGLNTVKESNGRGRV